MIIVNVCIVTLYKYMVLSTVSHKALGFDEFVC